MVFCVFRKSKGQQSADRLFQMWQPLASFQQMRGEGMRLELYFYLALVSLGRILLASQCQITHFIRFFRPDFHPAVVEGQSKRRWKTNSPFNGMEVFLTLIKNKGSNQWPNWMIFIVTAQKGEGIIFMAQASNLLFWPSSMPDMALLHICVKLQNHVEAQCARFKILFCQNIKVATCEENWRCWVSSSWYSVLRGNEAFLRGRSFFCIILCSNTNSAPLSFST